MKNQRSRSKQVLILRREDQSLKVRKRSMSKPTNYAYYIRFIKKAMFPYIELANDCTFLTPELER
jgi:hypothetical protein